MKLALQDAGRKMSSYIRKTVKAREQRERVNLFEKYIPELANSLSVLTGEKPDIIEENFKYARNAELQLVFSRILSRYLSPE